MIFPPKLQLLAEIEGYKDVFSMLDATITDSINPGICTNEGCDYTVNVEPDCGHGYCEECETQTVQSASILAGII